MTDPTGMWCDGQGTICLADDPVKDPWKSTERRVRAFSQQSRGAIVYGFPETSERRVKGATVTRRGTHIHMMGAGQDGESAARGRLMFIQWHANSFAVEATAWGILVGCLELADADRPPCPPCPCASRRRRCCGCPIKPAGSFAANGCRLGLRCANACGRRMRIMSGRAGRSARWL